MQQNNYRQHISAQFNAELESIKQHLLEMGGLVEQQLNRALNTLLEGDTGLAEEVIADDRPVNRFEVTIDEECSKILALRQPAASDLRLIFTVLKMTTDLERIGDEAVKIARGAVRALEEGRPPGDFAEVADIGQRVAAMLRKSLDAFARLDVEVAVQIIIQDRDIDIEYSRAMRALITFMMEDARSIGPVLNEMWALRSLERVGDHASNIAEYVVYLVQGRDVRHVQPQDLAVQLEVLVPSNNMSQ
ncbi:MAG: phosphate signaling complex protein PhoU [Parahaliea sp.]